MHFGETGSHSTDSDLEQRIVNFLHGQHMSDLRRVIVRAFRGVVTIRGKVRSFHQKQLCLHCCQRVAGVVRVEDELEVLAA